MASTISLGRIGAAVAVREGRREGGREGTDAYA